MIIEIILREKNEDILKKTKKLQVFHSATKKGNTTMIIIFSSSLPFIYFPLRQDKNMMTATTISSGVSVNISFI